MPKLILRRSLGLAIMLALVSSLASAGGTVVNVYVEPDAVFFEPTGKLEAGEITVVVSGPENCFSEKDYERGETGVFKIIDDKGNLIPDGEYSFMVTHRPILSGRDKKILAEARERNDPDEIKKLRKEGIVRERLTDAGYFRVYKGKFVYKVEEKEPAGGNRVASSSHAGSGESLVGAAEANLGGGDLVGRTLADFVILDDLIVDGSACIGFDCVNGESFGFDTIRLKENNLRIKFDDTSTAASFPRTDWQLTANASANGGASKFSIDDISGGRTPFTVEANARSHSLYVDDGGRIGNRTSTPSTEIHSIDGDTPTLRLQQDGSSGFAPQTWDVAGNETNFFIRDVSNGSTLPFRLRPGAPTSAIDIAGNGDVGLGTGGPDASLHVLRSDGTAKLLVEENGSTADARGLMELRNNGTVFFRLEDTSTSTVWNFQNQANQAIISSPSGSNVEFTLDTNGNLTLGGSLTTGGGGACSTVPCDGVFDPEIYTVPTIEDHAAEMWSKKHLPAVGPTLPGQPIDVTDKLTRMLNELETAHIYIEQLHKELQELRAEMRDAREQDD